MDNSKIIHIAAETVLLAGVTFYFNSQIKGLRNEIRDLKTKIEEHSEAHNKHLNNLYALVDKLTRSPPQFLPQQQQKLQPHKLPDTGIRHRRRPDENENPKQRPTVRLQPVLEETNEDEPDSLDHELNAELQELQEEDEQDVDDENSESQLSSKDVPYSQQEHSLTVKKK